MGKITQLLQCTAQGGNMLNVTAVVNCSDHSTFPQFVRVKTCSSDTLTLSLTSIVNDSYILALPCPRVTSIQYPSYGIKRVEVYFENKLAFQFQLRSATLTTEDPHASRKKAQSSHASDAHKITPEGVATNLSSANKYPMFSVNAKSVNLPNAAINRVV